MWVPGLGAGGGTGPFCSELSKGAILWPTKAFWPSFEAGMWVPGLGADWGTGPLCSEPSKGGKLLPTKALWPNIEAEMWVPARAELVY